MRGERHERLRERCPGAGAGAATWGYTRAEALRNIQDVARMVVDSLVEHGEALPSEPSDQVQILAEPQVAVIV
jgi:hypothetical protein